MKHSKCRICGDRHPLGQCGFGRAALERLSSVQVPAAQIAVLSAAALPSRSMTASEVGAGQFDKRAWQREYMREHRAGKRRRSRPREMVPGDLGLDAFP